MDVIRQKVRVDFEYPVYFTNGVVTPSNLLLRDVVARSADQTPSRLIVVLDQGVLDHHPRSRATRSPSTPTAIEPSSAWRRRSSSCPAAKR